MLSWVSIRIYPSSCLIHLYVEVALLARASAVSLGCRRHAADESRAGRGRSSQHQSARHGAAVGQRGTVGHLVVIEVKDKHSAVLCVDLKRGWTGQRQGSLGLALGTVNVDCSTSEVYQRPKACCCSLGRLDQKAESSQAR